ncbi:MAG: hypothetical protein ACRCW1_05205 [Anaerotignaceae bacterium]
MDFDLKRNIDEDLMYCKDIWKKYSYDPEKMEELFTAMIFKYESIIEGFSQDMEVISPFDTKIKAGEAIRRNVDRIIKTFEIVKAQGYKDNCLKEYYLKQGVKGKVLDLNFNEVRVIFNEDFHISHMEKKEILNKIDEIEEICISVDTKKNKWDKLRPYVVWSTGKDADTAIIILSLILKIN